MVRAPEIDASVVAAGGLSLWGGQSPDVLAQSPVPPTSHKQYRAEPRTAERRAVRMRFASDELKVRALLNRADRERLSTLDVLDRLTNPRRGGHSTGSDEGLNSL